MKNERILVLLFNIIVTTAIFALSLPFDKIKGVPLSEDHTQTVMKQDHTEPIH